jgi:hypothetical protein
LEKTSECFLTLESPKKLINAFAYVYAASLKATTKNDEINDEKAHQLQEYINAVPVVFYVQLSSNMFNSTDF